MQAVLGNSLGISVASFMKWESLLPPKLALQTWKKAFRFYMDKQVHTALMQDRGGHPSSGNKTECWNAMVSKATEYLVDKGTLVSIVFHLFLYN